MSILSEEIVIHKGDLYEHINIVTAVEKLSWINIDKLAKYAIKNCPLDKWPEWAEKCVKSHLNAQNRIVIDEKPHPFIPNQIQIDFCYGGGTIFVAYCVKKEIKKEDPDSESSRIVYGPYIPITPMPTGCTPRQDLQEVPTEPDCP